jgi:hypothetical protein
MAAEGIMEAVGVQPLHSTRPVLRMSARANKHLLESIAYENEKHSHSNCAKRQCAWHTHDLNGRQKSRAWKLRGLSE